MTDDHGSAYWVGGYTSDAGGRAEGIARVVPSGAGGLRLAGPEHPWSSPSFLARHPELPLVYSADEVAGTVTAHRVESLDPVALTAVVSQPAGPLVCHVAVSPDAGYLAAACWGDGAVLVYPLGDDGLPGVPLAVAPAVDPHADARRVTPPPFGLEPGSRAHFVHWVSATRFVVTDLGFDLLREIELVDGAPEVLGSTALPFGSGPRHLTAARDGRLVVVTEYSCEAVVLEPAGGVDERETADRDRESGRPVPVPAGGGVPAGRGYRIAQRLALREGGPRPGDTAAHLCASADGRFLYAGVRGSDVIAVLRHPSSAGGSGMQPGAHHGGETADRLDGRHGGGRGLQPGIDHGADSADRLEVEPTVEPRVHRGSEAADQLDRRTGGGPVVGLERVGEFASGGATPRHHVVDGALLHIAHQGSDEITTHTLDPATGLSRGVTHRLPLGTPSMLLPTS